MFRCWLPVLPLLSASKHPSLFKGSKIYNFSIFPAWDDGKLISVYLKYCTLVKVSCPFKYLFFAGIGEESWFLMR